MSVAPAGHPLATLRGITTTTRWILRRGREKVNRPFLTDLCTRLDDDGQAIQLIRSFYYPDAAGGARNGVRPDTAPVYVMFVTDGETFDKPESEKQITWAAYEPMFWQFMAIGKSNKDIKQKGVGGWLQRLAASDFGFLEKLDTMTGRFIDNANFFSVEDPATIGDEELYALLMAEYPQWLKKARAQGLLR